MDAEGPRSLAGLSSKMTYGQMRRFADRLDLTVASALLPRGKTGFYDEATRTILIDRRLIYCQKRCTLVHELIHWSHADSTHEGVFGSRAESRAKRETALTLISLPEYEMAERLYEGEPYQMACELDVTLQVVLDYQRMLDDAKQSKQGGKSAFALR